ncbi:hypothetical protein BpHYR1_034705 [Brachionus plicatilis]|uniref:Uncharacterized protein n=1 Tax=Brachionus plicatilis TaxID=10195 RepID=A0A3M7PXT8_BRAPC|nr:hypothetical protein BpHYR1_034705 [Brachionus plicatilis]
MKAQTETNDSSVIKVLGSLRFVPTEYIIELKDLKEYEIGECLKCKIKIGRTNHILICELKSLDMFNERPSEIFKEVDEPRLDQIVQTSSTSDEMTQMGRLNNYDRPLTSKQSNEYVSEDESEKDEEETEENDSKMTPIRKTSSNSKTQEQAEISEKLNKIYDEEINKLFGAEHNDSSMQTLREKNAAKVAVLKIRFETESLRLGIDDWREYWNSILQKRRKKQWRGKQ